MHHPNNSGITQYTYSGNSVTVTDPAGAWKTFTTDALGNLRQVTEPNPAGGTFVTTYAYSTLNQLLTVSMPRPTIPAGGTVTQTQCAFNSCAGTFVYNSEQRLQSVTNPESGTTSYTYNGDGTLATKTDAKGQVLSYFYDTLGRLTQVKHGTVILRTLTYDANPDAQGNNYGTNLSGRLARIDYGEGNLQAGAMLKKKLSLTRYTYHPGSLEAIFTYDDEGRMKSIKYPDYTNASNYTEPGPTYTYTFDPMGRLLSLADGNNYKIAGDAAYGPAGELTAFGGETRTYNELKQLTGINMPPLGSIAYTYSATNNNGRITGMSSTLTGESVTYQYDSLNRLIGATSAGQWGLDFKYDGFGNRVSRDLKPGTWQGYVPTIQQSYDQQTNRLIGPTYDLNGNTYASAGVTGIYNYDVENRLLAVQQNPAISTDYYDYGIDNKRIYKLNESSVNTEEVYFYAGGRKLATYSVSYMDLNNDGFPSTILFRQPSYNVYFGSRLILANDKGVALDRLGSVVARYAPNGWEKYSYFPYGEERTPNGQPTANNRDKFGTYFRDAISRMDYADQRFYSSNAGRFLSPDPYLADTDSPSDPSDPQSWNRYGYVLADPITFYDSEGLLASPAQTRKVYEDEVQKWGNMMHRASSGGTFYFYWNYMNPGGYGGGVGGGGQTKKGGGAGNAADQAEREKAKQDCLKEMDDQFKTETISALNQHIAPIGYKIVTGILTAAAASMSNPANTPIAIFEAIANAIDSFIRDTPPYPEDKVLADPKWQKMYYDCLRLAN